MLCRIPIQNTTLDPKNLTFLTNIIYNFLDHYEGLPRFKKKSPDIEIFTFWALQWMNEWMNEWMNDWMNEYMEKKLMNGELMNVK